MSYHLLTQISESPGRANLSGLTGLEWCPRCRRLGAGEPGGFGEHGAGLFAGGTVDQVVAEEDLRRCSAGGTVLGDVVGADVHSRGGRGGDHLDGHSLAVSTGHTVGLAFRGLDDELQVGHVRRDPGQREGEGLALAGDGGGAGVLDTDECRRIADGGAAAGDDPVVEPGVQVAAGDLGFGAEDGTSLLREGELVPGEDFMLIFADSGQERSHWQDAPGRLCSSLREAGRGQTSTVSRRLWKGRSVWSNRLLTVTYYS